MFQGSSCGQEDFLKFFSIYGHGDHLGHMTLVILAFFKELTPQMLHTKFQGIRPSGCAQEDFLKIFTIIWTWRSSWSCDLDQVYILPLTFCEEAWQSA